MTDRYAGFIVTLEKDIRSDNAESILEAIKMVRGVRSVKPVVSDISTHIAQQRAEMDIREVLWKALNDWDKKRQEQP